MSLPRPIRLTRESVLIVVAGGAAAAGVTGAVGAFVLAPDGSAVLELMRSLGWVAGLLLLVAAAVAWLCGRNVAGDVEYLTSRLRAMAASEHHEPIAIRSLDEVGALTRAFEPLRERFIESVDRERRAREQAERADREKTAFLTAVSHELRTPLNSILGFAQVLLQEIEGPLSESQREDVEMIRSSGEHLLSLFNDVLDLSAMASGGITLHREPVDVRALLTEAAKLLDAQRRDKRIEIRTDIAPDLPPIDADPTRLRQIVMNLGANAVKFTAEGAVTLLAKKSGDHVVITVRDTGPGIARDQLATIFEEYRQVGDFHARRRGSGLGLAIARRLTELHGGRIEVDSLVAHGSEFRIWLPIRRPVA